MPSVRITNYTTTKLNVALKHLCALHFANEIEPGQTIKLKNVGRVWFTLEVLVDDGKNHYSIANSAACIAIVSIAAVATAAAAGAPLVAAAAGTTVSGAASAAGATITTAASAAGATVAAGISAVQGFIATNVGIAAKVSTTLLPKAIELVEKEVGGFNAVQKEVVAILSSPTVTEDVRKEGFSILQRLGAAFIVDQAAEEKAKELKEQEEREAKEKESQKEKPKEKESQKDKGKGKESTSTLKRLKTISRSASESSASPTKEKASAPSETSRRPTLKRVGQTTSALLSRMSPEARAAHQATKNEAKAEKEAASWELLDLKPDDEPMLLSANGLLRLHGLFVGDRKHFEVREKNGKLVLVDAMTGSTVKE